MNDRRTSADGLGAFRVTVFGAAHIDRLLITNGPAILGASNPGHTRDTEGGVAFNIASALARLGVPTRLVTRIGPDEAGNRVMKAIIQAGIDPVWTRREPAMHTATYNAVLDSAGSLIIGIADARIYDRVTPGTLVEPLAAAANLWIADANLPQDSLDAIVAAARTAGIPLAACAVSPSKAVRFAELLRNIAIWFGNRSEAEAVLGPAAKGATARELAEGLMKSGIASGFVSDGKAPFPAWHGGRIEIVKPPHVPLVASVNGAGDAQAAGTVYGLARGLGFFEALRYGIASAGLKVEREDPVRGDLTAPLLESRVASATEKTA